MQAVPSQVVEHNLGACSCAVLAKRRQFRLQVLLRPEGRVLQNGIQIVARFLRLEPF